jgi:hypothetical protein
MIHPYQSPHPWTLKNQKNDSETEIWKLQWANAFTSIAALKHEWRNKLKIGVELFYFIGWTHFLKRIQFFLGNVFSVSFCFLCPLLSIFHTTYSILEPEVANGICHIFWTGTFFSMEFAPFWCSNFSWIGFRIKVCLGFISSLFLDLLRFGFKCSQWMSVVLQSSFNVDSGVY